MKLAVCAVVTALFVCTVSVGHAKKKVTEPIVGPDLEATSLSVKSKTRNLVTSINNVTVSLKNIGDADAPNSQITYYLSLDDVLTTQVDALNPTVDTVLHTQSLGKVKAGKTKKSTLGGGHLKQAGATQGNYIIAVVDSKNNITEVDEWNNIVVSAPIK